MATQTRTRQSDRQPPVCEVTLGKVKVCVWENEHDGNSFHNVTAVRLYKDGDNWKESTSFGRDEIPVLRKALDEAWELVKDWSLEEYAGLRDGVPKSGFATPFRDGTVRNLACRVLAIARGGLRRRDIPDRIGHNEEGFLATLDENAASGKTPADYLLEDYRQRWDGDIDRIYAECAY